jgi:hypothetical protein
MGLNAYNQTQNMRTLSHQGHGRFKRTSTFWLLLLHYDLRRLLHCCCWKRRQFRKTCFGLTILNSCRRHHI